MDIDFSQLNYLFFADRLPYAIIAATLTMLGGFLLGTLGGQANPFFWYIIDKSLGAIGDKLNRAERPYTDLVFRGFLITAMGLFIGALFIEFSAFLIGTESGFGMAEILLLSVLITSGSVWYLLIKLFKTEKEKQAGAGAYFALAQSTRKNLTATDDFGLVRAAIGFSANSFARGFVAPLFWYVIGGFALAAIYTALAGVSWRFGKEGHAKGFAKIPMTLEYAMGIIPSWIAAVVFTIAAMLTPSANTPRAIGALWAAKGAATFAQGGRPLTVLAYAFNISLGGAFQDLSGSAVKGPWVGPEGATAQNNYEHLKRAVYLNIVAHLIILVLLLSIYALSA